MSSDWCRKVGTTMLIDGGSADFIGNTSNSYSSVLSVNYGEFDMLLTGDLEKEGEMELLQEFRENSFRSEWNILPIYYSICSKGCKAEICCATMLSKSFHCSK